MAGSQALKSLRGTRFGPGLCDLRVPARELLLSQKHSLACKNRAIHSKTTSHIRAASADDLLTCASVCTRSNRTKRQRAQILTQEILPMHILCTILSDIKIQTYPENRAHQGMIDIVMRRQLGDNLVCRRLAIWFIHLESTNAPMIINTLGVDDAPPREGRAITSHRGSIKLISRRHTAIVAGPALVANALACPSAAATVCIACRV